jgi:hypothetical protein
MGLLNSLPIIGKFFVSREPRSEQVTAFWAYMQAHFGTSLLNQLNNAEIDLITQALDTIRIGDRASFLNRCSLTIGKRIYVPFEPGVARPGWDLWRQMVLCVHEHQHVVQHERLGLEFAARYMADRAERANYEVEALRSDLELEYWRTRKVPSTKALAERLYNYGCRKDDVAFAAKALSLAAVPVRKGAVVNESSKVALDWLNERSGEFAFLRKG